MVNMGKDGKKAPYSPMGVLGMLKEHGVPVPVGANFGKKATMVDSAGSPMYKALPTIETCAILVLAFLHGSSAVPDDFAGLERTGAALKTYVRPDGGVYIGTFQAHGEPDGMIAVFGDPAMSQTDGQKVAMHYRAFLKEQYDGHHAVQELGPFAGLPVGLPVAAQDAPLPSSGESTDAPVA